MYIWTYYEQGRVSNTYKKMDYEGAGEPIRADAPLVSIDQSSEIAGNKRGPLPGFGWVIDGMKDCVPDGEPGDTPFDPLNAPCFLCEMAIEAPKCVHKTTMDAMAREGSQTVDPKALYEEMALYAREQIFVRAMRDPEFARKGFVCNAAVIYTHYFSHMLDPQLGAANELRAIRALKHALYSNGVERTPDGALVRPEIDTVRMLQLLGKAESDAFARMQKSG